MADYDPEMIEALARTIAGIDPSWKHYRDETALALSALPLTPEALNALWRGEAVVVPKQQTREMLDARQMVHGFAPLTNKRWKDIESARVGIAWNDASIVDEAWSAMLAASPYAKKE